MEICYGNNKIKKQLSSATEMKKAFGANATRVSIRLDEIRASPNLKILMQIPAANCHQLSGNRKNEWAVDISRNHRLIFEIWQDPVPKTENNEVDTIRVTDIQITKTEDYH